jgi:hypothetical protein
MPTLRPHYTLSGNADDRAHASRTPLESGIISAAAWHDDGWVAESSRRLIEENATGLGEQALSRLLCAMRRSLFGILLTTALYLQGIADAPKAPRDLVTA